MAIVGGIVYQTFRMAVFKFSKPFHSRICKEKKDEVKRDRYIERMCESTAKSTFHTTAFIWGYVVLKQANWLPWCIGGEGALDVVLKNNVVTELPFGIPLRAVITYGLFTSGYHLSELFRYTFISDRKSDYEEMVVHHIVTVMLYFGYIIANIHCIGAFVAVLHDVADIFTNLGRIAQGTEYEKVSVTFFFIVLVTWAWTRLYILPYTIWFMESDLIPEFFSKMELASVYVPYIHSMAFFLGCLAILHYWWFFLIVQMLYGLMTRGQLVDLQRKVDYENKAEGKKTK